MDSQESKRRPIENQSIIGVQCPLIKFLKETYIDEKVELNECWDKRG